MVARGEFDGVTPETRSRSFLDRSKPQANNSPDSQLSPDVVSRQVGAVAKFFVGIRRVALGGYPPQGSHRSVLAQLTHTAPHLMHTLPWRRLVVTLTQPPASMDRPCFPPKLHETLPPVGWSTGARTVGSGGSSTPFVVGLSPAPMVTFPAAPPKIPYGGFSPVRLQVPGTTQFSRESSVLDQWLKFDPNIRHWHKPLALAFGIASAEEVPASMCGAAASDNSTWTQRSSLRRACHGLTFIAY